MAKEQAPYMPFFGRDFYGDVNVMAQDLEEQGAYIRLSWLCWQEGTIPADVAMLAMICSNTPVSRFKKKIWPKLCGLFEAAPDGRLVHRKIESIRDGKEAFRKKCSDAGKIGNDRRWGTHRVPDANPIDTRSEPDQNPNRVGIAKPSLSFSSSFTITETTKTLCASDDARGDGALELTPPKPEHTDEIREWFLAEFWPTYPRKRSKPQALKAARKHAKTAQVREIIMQCLRRRLPVLQEQFRPEGDFRPYPERWLNQTPWVEPEEAERPTDNAVARILEEQFRVRG
jgi:uncharacterized protein YdaU (DUF1376 family)